MGQWLATLWFPDVSRRYATYSTVVECLLARVHAGFCATGDTLPDGGYCYRSTVIGDADPAWPYADVGPVEDLVPIVVTVEPDVMSWHALFCRPRGRVLGPLSGSHRWHLQEEFSLFRDADGVRHLHSGRPGGSAVCGAAVSDGPLPFRRYPHHSGMPESDEPEAPLVDLFADWAAATVCRTCLVGQLPTVQGW